MPDPVRLIQAAERDCNQPVEHGDPKRYDKHDSQPSADACQSKQGDRSVRSRSAVSKDRQEQQQDGQAIQNAAKESLIFLYGRLFVFLGQRDNLFRADQFIDRDMKMLCDRFLGVFRHAFTPFGSGAGSQSSAFPARPF